MTEIESKIEQVKSFLANADLEGEVRMLGGYSCEPSEIGVPLWDFTDPVTLYLGNIIHDIGVPIDGNKPDLSDEVLTDLTILAIRRLREERSEHLNLVVRIDYDTMLDIPVEPVIKDMLPRPCDNDAPY